VPRTISFHKTRRDYGNPVEIPKEHPRFEPPPLSNNSNLNLPLDVVSLEASTHANEVKQLVFHAVGDTGGINDGGVTQTAIAEEMEAQIINSPDSEKAQFFYNLGDVVYWNGISYHYPEQFYEPYKHYPAPIFAIAGNHDGDTHVHKGNEADPEPSLTGFMKNFCDSQPRYLDSYRPTMTQPYVYWTLDAPFATIIGLYSNVDGLLDGLRSFQQQSWFEDQMKNAPKDKCLIVAVHHPPYSLDTSHGGYSDIGNAIDRAGDIAGRYPNAVLSGHVHCYQRFTRTIHHQKIAYIVAGAGGYAHSFKAIHKLQKDPVTKMEPSKPFKHLTIPHLELDNYNDAMPGFLRITVDATTLKGEYFVVPFDDAPPNDPFDTFSIQWKN